MSRIAWESIENTKHMFCHSKYSDWHGVVMSVKMNINSLKLGHLMSNVLPPSVSPLLTDQLWGSWLFSFSSPVSPVWLRFLIRREIQNPLQKLSQGHTKAQKKKYNQNKRLFKRLKKSAIEMQSTLNRLNDTLRPLSTATMRSATTLWIIMINFCSDIQVLLELIQTIWR